MLYFKLILGMLLSEINEGRKFTKNEGKQINEEQMETNRKRGAGKASLLQCK